jgi:hypothetical protein
MVNVSKQALFSQPIVGKVQCEHTMQGKMIVLATISISESIKTPASTRYLIGFNASRKKNRSLLPRIGLSRL